MGEAFMFGFFLGAAVMFVSLWIVAEIYNAGKKEGSKSKNEQQ